MVGILFSLLGSISDFIGKFPGVLFCVEKVKDLNEEYARLLPDKKTAYAEYRKLRDEAQELLIAQSNIGRWY